VGLDGAGPRERRGGSLGDLRLFGGARRGPYAALLHDAEAGWTALERHAGVRLLARDGMLAVGSPAAAALRDLAAAAAVTGRVLEELTPAAAARVAPSLRVDPGEVALLDPAGGVLHVDPALSALRRRAIAVGAELRHGCTVSDIQERGSSVRVVVARASHAWMAGGTFEAAHVVICAGAWASRVAPELSPHLTVWPIPLIGLPSPHGGEKSAGWVVHEEGGPFVGASTGSLLQLAGRGLDEPVLDADAAPREPRPEELASLLAFARRRLGAPHDARPLRASLGIEAYSGSGDFVVDRLAPGSRRVVVTGLSGQGFKYAPALGEHVASVVLGDPTSFPLVAPVAAPTPSVPSTTWSTPDAGSP